MVAKWRQAGQWQALVEAQCGVVSRAQLLGCGWTADDVTSARRFAGWRSLGGGVYAVHAGPLPPAARAWAAVLRCGPGAALACGSALTAWGVGGVPSVLSRRVHVAVEETRHPRAPEGVVLHRLRGLDDQVHPVADPPRQRIEVAVLDAAAECTQEGEGTALLLQVLAERRTTPDRLLGALSARPRLPGRAIWAGLVEDARSGVASRLELEFLTRVHRAHGLPAALFNSADVHRGQRVYRDVVYPGRLVVELDGAAYHGQGQAVSDRWRDNDLALLGLRTLRFGWPEVTGDPCSVAAAILAALGCAGRACGTGCGLRAATLEQKW
ncbi:MAG: DUF559 domain-containing protein [Kineosporiaceae bacterium]